MDHIFRCSIEFSVNHGTTFDLLWIQDGVDSDKLQSSERTLKSRAILGRSVANGIVADQVECIFFF